MKSLYRFNSLFIFLFIPTLFFFACAPPSNNSKPPIAIQKPVSAVATKHIPIDSSGYFIELPPNIKITNQKGSDFMVYYFTPIDTSSNKGESGIYFGPKPDAHPPTTDFSKTEMLGVFLGRSVQWTVYTTSKYTQREVFLDEGNGNKIHVWCYAANPVELELLFKMINSISK